MNYTMIWLISCWIFLITFALAAEHHVEGKQGNLIRQKKRIVTLKKPFRYNERVRGRQANYPRSTAPSTDKYTIIGTSENPNGNWKPIPYAHYAEEAAPAVKPKPAPANSVIVDNGKPAISANGGSGHIERAVDKNVESEPPTSSSQPEHVSNEQFTDYALLHYYIPFDQLIAQTPKPIMETLQEVPPKPISIEELMKAAVEPIPVFRVETTTTTTTAAPTTSTVKSEPPTTTTVIHFPPEPKSEEKEDKFSGQYEYEYFVQDNRWGTNFGHKEIRDGKQTKGDYEVVLPDGRVQHVQYWSDATGYHASVTYHPLYEKFKQYKMQS